MTIPKQPFGLNKFATSVSHCPVNPDAIRSVVFQQNGMAVINGATTEISLSLLNFFIPVTQAAKLTFTVPKKDSLLYSLTKLDLGGIDINGEVKVIALFPQFPLGTTGATVASNQQYLEWASVESIESGVLYDQLPVGPSASANTSLKVNYINCMEFGWGSNISFTGGTGPLWIGTDGGLLKWDGTDMKLWNTLNSNSPSDFINSIAVNSGNNLWIASMNGISLFNETSNFYRIYNSDNSSLLSDHVNVIKILSADKIVAGTDAGMSIYNFSADTWESFDMYTTPELTQNDITKLAISDSKKIFLGTSEGVFLYDSSTLTWNTLPFNSANTPGWTAPDEVKALAVKGSVVYVGTTAGLVAVPYLGGTAATIVAGITGPVSSNITSLRSVTYGGSELLYVGHDDGISVLDTVTGIWGFTANSGDHWSFDSNVNDLIPDFLSGTTGGKTIFYGMGSAGSTVSGIFKVIDDSRTFSVVPETNKSANLLMTYPVNGSSLCANTQPLYFLFSKPMNTSTFENVTSLKDGEGSAVSGSWTWSFQQQVATFTPSSSLSKASLYNLTILHGARGLDTSYLKESLNFNFYTENLVPVLGWEPLGKILAHSGATDHYVQGLYIRNPQSFDVPVIALIGS